MALAAIAVGGALLYQRVGLALQFRMNRINTRRDGGRNSRGTEEHDGFSFLSALKMAAGGGLGGGGGNPIWSLVWFLALLFAAFPVAGFCAGWYILILPFSVCVDGLTGICEMLLKGVQCTHFCAKHMMEGTPVMEAFK